MAQNFGTKIITLRVNPCTTNEWETYTLTITPALEMAGSDHYVSIDFNAYASNMIQWEYSHDGETYTPCIGWTGFLFTVEMTSYLLRAKLSEAAIGALAEAVDTGGTGAVEDLMAQIIKPMPYTVTGIYAPLWAMGEGVVAPSVSVTGECVGAAIIWTPATPCAEFTNDHLVIVDKADPGDQVRVYYTLGGTTLNIVLDFGTYYSCVVTEADKKSRKRTILYNVAGTNQLTIHYQLPLTAAFLYAQRLDIQPGEDTARIYMVDTGKPMQRAIKYNTQAQGTSCVQPVDDGGAGNASANTYAAWTVDWVNPGCLMVPEPYNPSQWTRSGTIEAGLSYGSIDLWKYMSFSFAGVAAFHHYGSSITCTVTVTKLECEMGFTITYMVQSVSANPTLVELPYDCPECGSTYTPDGYEAYTVIGTIPGTDVEVAVKPHGLITIGVAGEICHIYYDEDPTRTFSWISHQVQGSAIIAVRIKQ